MTDKTKENHPSNAEGSMNKMGTMPVGRLMMSMSLPAIFSMMISALYNIVDSIFVAQIGEQALTAVSLIFPVQMMITAVGVGTGVGLNSLISRRLGEQRFAEANSVASHGILLALFSGIVFAVFGLFFSENFVSAFTDSKMIIQYGVDYCWIVSTFAVFIFMQMCCEKTIQATGNMILPMISMLTGAITNIILDPILIFGLFGAPVLGVAGAAIATVIGQAFAMCVILTAILKMKLDIHVSLRNLKLDFHVIRNIYAVGLPAMVMQSVGSFMIVCLNAILITFSETAVAVLGIYFKLQSFVFMPVFGLNQGTMPILGYNFGARNKDRLMQAFRLALIAAAVIMAAGCAVFQLLPRELLLMFKASPDMLSVGIRALRLISLCFVPAAFGIMCSTLFQAIGHGTVSLIVSLMRQLVLILPMAYWISRFWGLDYFWLAFPLAELAAMAASFVFLRRVYQREIMPLEKTT